MPVQTSYPGVYIEELPSGQSSIVPASTSVTAFVGRAPFGPVNESLPISSFGDFQTLYGGLSSNYPLTYAVWDFFANGGSQAVIARLFEPNSVVDTGVAQLAFPPALPPIPDGWMLASVPAPASTQVAITPPTGGSEGSPIPGMTLTFGPDTNLYTVLNYDPVKQMLTITPPLIAGPDYCECWELNFGPLQEPSGWTIAAGSGSKQIIISGGNGIPQLGDQFTLASDPLQVVYTITAEPTVNANSTVTISSFVPAMPNNASFYLAVGAGISIGEPSPAPMPMGWNVHAMKTVGTVLLINGQGNPMPYDLFTAGSNNIYMVKSFTPGDSTKSPPTPATLVFVAAAGATWPPPSSDFGRCATLAFLPRVPSGYTIQSAPKIGGTSLTLGTTTATVGPVAVGDMFQVQGDETVYIIRTFDPVKLVAQFLPAAVTNFSGTIRISQGLTLQAASPGLWGNLLTATVDTNGITPKTASSPSISQYGLEVDDLFNLSLILKSASNQTLKTERYLNVSVRTDGIAGNYPNRLDLVLQSQSMLASITQFALPLLPPSSGAATAGIGGDDGTYLEPETYIGDENLHTGLYMLDGTGIDLLCIPPDWRLGPTVPLTAQDLDPTVRQQAAEYCTTNRAIYIADPPAIWATQVQQGEISDISPDNLEINGVSASGIEYERNVAVYFPRIYKEDLLAPGVTALFAACGAIAGAIAANDVARGVWKAPAGTSVGLAGVSALEVALTDVHSGYLNPLGINCLRTFPLAGTVIWGGRTLRGADILQDDYKYLSVRRLTLYIESSLFQSTQWAVFEPNDESLWSSLRLSVGSFLAQLSQQGAFYNYAVACDSTTTSVADIEAGRVNILVQIAPVDPAEFVMIQIQQVAPQLTS